MRSNVDPSIEPLPRVCDVCGRVEDPGMTEIWFTIHMTRTLPKESDVVRCGNRVICNNRSCMESVWRTFRGTV